MEGSSTTITTTASTSDQSNKENVPPVCNGNKGKIPISQKGPSFKNKNKNKNKNKKKNKRSKRKPKIKRVPLADITALFNNSATTTTTTTTTTTSTLPHQPQIEVSALPSDASVSRRKSVTPASKTLRMGFR